MHLLSVITLLIIHEQAHAIWGVTEGKKPAYRNTKQGRDVENTELVLEANRWVRRRHHRDKEELPSERERKSSSKHNRNRGKERESYEIRHEDMQTTKSSKRRHYASGRATSSQNTAKINATCVAQPYHYVNGESRSRVHGESYLYTDAKSVSETSLHQQSASSRGADTEDDAIALELQREIWNQENKFHDEDKLQANNQMVEARASSSYNEWGSIAESNDDETLARILQSQSMDTQTRDYQHRQKTSPSGECFH